MEHVVGDDHVDTVLRRVFGLCFLNTLQYATFRQVLNVNRKSDEKSALDYTTIDYNYVTIKRKEMPQILYAIMQQPGPSIVETEIASLTTNWSKIQRDEALPSYVLKGHRLVKDSDSPVCKRPFVVWDNCPRTGQPRLSFLITFLKSSLPDLMGDSKFENLIQPELVDGPDITKCVACLVRVRNTILTPCNHIILCSECCDILKPVECLLCRNVVEKTEKVYLS